MIVVQGLLIFPLISTCLVHSYAPITKVSVSQVARIGRSTNTRCITTYATNTEPILSETEEIIHDGSNHDNISISSWERFSSAVPRVRIRSDPDQKNSQRIQLGDSVDRTILGTAVPSMINLAVVPLVNAVDTYWVGRMGVALALAGQAAANQAFFTIFFLVAFVPNVTAPLVAMAVGSGDMDAAQDRVCESLFLSNVLGILGTLGLLLFPEFSLRLVLPKDAPALSFAVPYLRLRTLSMVPALVSASGFAAYRGLLDTVTPLKVSLFTNALNVVVDPLLVFGRGGTAFMGATGAALATAGSETISGLIYLRLLFQKKLVQWKKLYRPPPMERLLPLLKGGLAMLARQTILNVAFLSATRRAQVMDLTGVIPAAYGIVMQIYSVGIVIHLGIQSTAATLVPAALASADGGPDKARKVADRLFMWGTGVGILLAATQSLLLPFLVPMFSTLPEVQEAVRAPAAISALIHIVNGPVFAGEGCMLGLQAFSNLALITGVGVSVMLGLLKLQGNSVNGILWSLAGFNTCQAVLVLLYHLKIGPLARKKSKNNQ